MLAVNYSEARNKLKDYCDKACDEKEVIVITRKDKRHVVLIALDRLNSLIKNDDILNIQEDVKADNLV